MKRRAARDEQLEVATALNQFRGWNCGMTELLIMTACDLAAACGHRQSTSRSGSATTRAVPGGPSRARPHSRCYRVLALTSAGAVVVRIPETASQADAAASFLDQCRSGERLVVASFLRGHGHPSDRSSKLNFTAVLIEQPETESRKTRPCTVLPVHAEPAPSIKAGITSEAVPYTIRTL